MFFPLNPRLRSATGVALLLLCGCPTLKDTDETELDDSNIEETDGPLDTEEPEDTEELQDTDIEEPDTDVHGLTGTISYTSTVDGDVICDAEIALTGSEYTGKCPGCDFAFEVEGAISNDNNTPSCGMPPLYTFVEDFANVDLKLAFAEDYSYWYEPYTDVVLVGYGDDNPFNLYQGGWDGIWVGGSEYWIPLASDQSEYGKATFDGDVLSWTFDYVGADKSIYGHKCGVSIGHDYDGKNSGDTQSGTLGGTGNLVDVWTFDAHDGGSAWITVDNVNGNNPHVFSLKVVDPYQCTLGETDRDFYCTSEGDDEWGYPLECPSYKLIDDLVDGTYQIVVSKDSCMYGEAFDDEYEIRVDVGGDANLSLLHDDVTGADTSPTIHHISVTGTVAIAK